MDKCNLHNERLSTIEADIKLLLERSARTESAFKTAGALSAWAIGVALTALALVVK